MKESVVVDVVGFVRLASVNVIFEGAVEDELKPPVMVIFLVAELKVHVGLVLSKPYTPLQVKVLAGRPI